VAQETLICTILVPRPGMSDGTRVFHQPQLYKHSVGDEVACELRCFSVWSSRGVRAVVWVQLTFLHAATIHHRPPV
jgi:hypothetical protein